MYVCVSPSQVSWDRRSAVSYGGSVLYKIEGSPPSTALHPLVATEGPAKRARPPTYRGGRNDRRPIPTYLRLKLRASGGSPPLPHTYVPTYGPPPRTAIPTDLGTVSWMIPLYFIFPPPALSLALISYSRLLLVDAADGQPT